MIARPRVTLWVSALLLITLGFVLGASLMPAARATAAPADLLQVGAQEQLTQTEQLYANIYNQVAPSVVSITTTTSEEALGGSVGSGFVIDFQGHVVTNFHVVEGADRVEINMFDGTIARAEIIGLDPDSDLAVLQVNVPAERLRPIVWGNSDALVVGQTTAALGNPFNNDWTFTTGIISALERSIVGLNAYSIGGVIQTDAAINPGNSGGPLVNLRGEVIGVNSQIDSAVRANSGVGFPLPNQLVKKVSEQLIANGSVRYSFLGIRSRAIDLDLIEAFSLPNNIRGVAVQEVTPGFPAATAGLRGLGRSVDVITAINGRPLDDFDELVGYLAINTNPGDTVTMTVYRDGSFADVQVTLVERPQ